MKIKYFFRSQM